MFKKYTHTLRNDSAYVRRMPSSGMIDNVAPVKTDVSVECIVSIIRVKRIRARNNVSSN
jgi:hypothetical protein